MDIEHKIDRKTLIIISLFFLSLFIKLISKVDYLEDYDALDFAFALKEYDLPAYKPHFPGYPVYIFFARALFLLFKDETLSLIMLNTIFGSLCSVAAYLIAVELFDGLTAIIAALLFIASPAVSILSVSVNSDISALFFLLMFTYYIIRSDKYPGRRVRYMFVASVLLGLTLGIRASYAPFLFLWLYYSRFFALFKFKDYDDLSLDDNSFLAAITGLALGVALWFLPLIFIVGIKGYYYEGVKFVTGHFSDWGGTIITEPSVTGRLSDFAWQLFAKGLGTYYFDTSVVRLAVTIAYLAAGIVLIKNKLYKPKLFLLYTLPYLLWVFTAQNLHKVRHVLPFVPVMIIFLSHPLSEFIKGAAVDASPVRGGNRYRAAAIAIVTALLFFDTSALLYRHKKDPPPPYSVMKYLTGNSPEDESVLYCGEVERFFTYYNPAYPVRRFKTAKEMIDDLDGSLVEPENIYVTSSLEGVKEYDVKEVITFARSRYIYNPYNKITLYKLNRGGINLLEY